MDLKEQGANPNRHPWELSRADMALQLLAGNTRDTRYADVGSGDMYFARRLCELTDAPVYTVDVNYTEAEVEGQLVVCTNLAQVPAGSVDCAVLMDVLEHVDDDVGFLHAVGRILTQGGRLLITVPAHAFLWSDHDVFLSHRRRYNRRHLREVLERGGLNIDECFYFYGVPFLVRTALVGLSRLGVARKNAGAVSLWPYPSQHPITRAVRAMLNGDFRLSRLLAARSLPGCGLSICAICRRRSA